MNIINTDYGMSDKTYSVFVSGCKSNPRCEGCFNPESWDFNYGEDWLNWIPKIKEDLDLFSSLIEKILVVGGEPLDQEYEPLEKLLTFLINFNKPVCLFTRYSIEEVPSFVKEMCDYIKCGPYIPSLTCENNIQYGIKLATSNQKIYKKGTDY